MSKVICPHCGEQEEHWIMKEYFNAHYFWCGHCAELSVYDSKIVPPQKDEDVFIRKPTQAELDVIYNGNPEQEKKLNSHMWLPKVNKGDIKFEIACAEYGDDGNNETDFDFSEAERYLKLLFHKMGTMPMVGDVVEGKGKTPKTVGPNGYKNYSYTFVIIARRWGLNDYQEMHLFVIHADQWMKENGITNGTLD